MHDGVAAYVDLARCNDKRRCVEVCKAGAIDFSQTPRKAAFDLVLDLGNTPMWTEVSTTLHSNPFTQIFGALRDRQMPLNAIFGVFAGIALLSIFIALCIRPRELPAS